MTSFLIPARFNGPPKSANGGYACGCVAQFLDGTPQIRLHSPPPLDTPIGVTVTDGEAHAHDGSTAVAEGRRGAIAWSPPTAPSAKQARRARDRFTGWAQHFFSTCFVCGPDRADGLRIFAGPVDGRDLVACDWTPDHDFARGGAVDPRIVWAALDCPSFFGTGVAYDQLYLLGQMTAELEPDIPEDRRYVVYGWGRGRKGRKFLTGSALADDTGTVWAKAEHVWIKVE